MKFADKIYVAGHNGMVGSAVVRALRKAGYNNLVLRASAELDLRHQDATNLFFEEEKPQYVFMCAAKVGGIQANNIYRAQFLYDNLMIAANVTEAAYRNGVEKMLFLGSSCIYPKLAPQPLKERYLLTGELETTNEPYAIAKIAGIKLCESYRRQYDCNFIAAMPTNLYGPGDNYHPENSHVLPALLRKFHAAAMHNLPEVELWGDGTPYREFLHVDDLAAALLHLMLHYHEEEFVNVGFGSDLTIDDLAQLIADITGFKGSIRYDKSKPNGTPRKLMDSSKLLNMGWKPEIDLRTGIERVYNDVKHKLND